MKFYSLGLGVMRRGQRAGGLGHTRSLLAQTGLQTADPAAALSLLISKPLYLKAGLSEEIDAQSCKKFRDTLLILPNNYGLNNLKHGSGVNNSCKPGPIPRSLFLSLSTPILHAVFGALLGPS